MQMHSIGKEQREAVRQLLHMVLIRDMGSFNPEQFKQWIKDLDQKFRKVGLTLRFSIRDRVVHFNIRELRSRRNVFSFPSSTRVPFDDRDVIVAVEQLASMGIVS